MCAASLEDRSFSRDADLVRLARCARWLLETYEHEAGRITGVSTATLRTIAQMTAGHVPERTAAKIVRAIIAREPLDTQMSERQRAKEISALGFCPHDGKELPPPAQKGAPRIFCSDRCRKAAWDRRHGWSGSEGRRRKRAS